MRSGIGNFRHLEGSPELLCPPLQSKKGLDAVPMLWYSPNNNSEVVNRWVQYKHIAKQESTSPWTADLYDKKVLALFNRRDPEGNDIWLHCVLAKILLSYWCNVWRHYEFPKATFPYYAGLATEPLLKLHAERMSLDIGYMRVNKDYIHIYICCRPHRQNFYCSPKI